MKVHKIAKPVRFKPVSSFINPPKDSLFFFCAFKFMSQKLLANFMLKFKEKQTASARLCQIFYFFVFLVVLLSMDKKSENT